MSIYSYLTKLFRRPNTPWPSDLPPCLAEATSAATSATRSPNGVAVLGTPVHSGTTAAFRSFSVIEIDNVNGLKVVLRINQFTVFAVYAPTSAGPGLLLSLPVKLDRQRPMDSPLYFCGDLNAPHSESVGNLDHL